jgi:hypothetical protein
MAVACVLAAAGCTTTNIVPQSWSKPEAGVQQVTYDDIQCRRAAETIGTGPGTIVGGFADAIVVTVQHVRREKTYARCMEANGYAPAQ